MKIMKLHKALFCLFLFFCYCLQAFNSTREYITGNGFKNFAYYYVENLQYNFDPKGLWPKSVIFVDRVSANFFFNELFPQIIEPFILITHNADWPSPGEFFSYLDDPRILRWYGENCDINYHPKFFPLPIGMSNPHVPFGDTRTMDIVLDSIGEPTHNKKNHKLYINFTVHDVIPERLKVFNHFKDKPFIFLASQKPFKEYLLEMSEYLFVLSPFGYGLDCFRTWEALLVGSIPVVHSSTLNPLYEGLPVIIVENWEEVTEEFLEKKYQEIKDKHYNKDKLFLPYWVNLIKDYKISLPFFIKGSENEFLTNPQFLICHVQDCMDKAEKKQSRLTKKILSLPGMSSPEIRCLLSNLCKIAGVRYLETGILKGSTFISALHGNHDYVVDAIAIYNWSEYGKNEFGENANIFLSHNKYRVIYCDAFNLHLEEHFNRPINIFFYNGYCSKDAHRKAFMYYDKVFADTFIAVVDAWNWTDVQKGTKEAFHELNYKILYEKELPAYYDSDLEKWWDGLYVAVIQKSHH